MKKWITTMMLLAFSLVGLALAGSGGGGNGVGG